MLNKKNRSGSFFLDRKADVDFGATTIHSSYTNTEHVEYSTAQLHVNEAVFNNILDPYVEFASNRHISRVICSL